MPTLPGDPAAVYKIHVFCCTNERPPTHRRGSCGTKDAVNLCHYMCRRAIVTAADWGIRVNTAGCLNMCEYGPVMVIYPEGIWYHYESEADIEEIIKVHVIRGEHVPRLLIRPDPLKMHK